MQYICIAPFYAMITEARRRQSIQQPEIGLEQDPNTSGSSAAKQLLLLLQEKYDHKFAVVFEAIRKLMTPPHSTRARIGFRAVPPPGAR